MKRTGLLISILILYIIYNSNLFAQEFFLTSKSKKAKKYFTSAMDYYVARDNQNCLAELGKALKADPYFIEAWMLTGDVNSDLKDFDKALEAYNKAIELDPDFFPRNFYNIGKIEFAMGLYNEAKEHYEKYLTYPKPNVNLLDKINRELKSCDFAIEAMKHPVDFEPEGMSDSINTPDGEYSPSLTVDEQTLIYTKLSPRNEYTIGKNPFEEDLYISKRVDGTWLKGRKMGPPMNTHGNEGAQCIAPDGKFMVFTGCNRDDGYGSCDLYISYRENNSWTVPVNMGPVVNSGQWDSQPSISPDGRVIYFSSARDGSKGNMDIWYTTRGNDGQWGTPVNIGDSINTVYPEMSPFIHPDNQTLFFASSGFTGMGGLDIYYSKRKENGGWSKPVNLGYPINTYKDEAYMIVNARGDLAYFASDKPGGKGKLDIYTFKLADNLRPKPVTYMKGIVFDKKTGKKLDARFELIDLASSQTIITSNSDAVTGEFLVCLPTDKDYALNVSKDGYLFYSENFSLIVEKDRLDPFLKDIPLQPIEAGETVILKNIFFDFDKAEPKPESQAELNKLVNLLIKNPQMKIEIGGHTDNKGTAEYNQQLSESRSKAVYDFLVAQNIDKKRLSYKGYGMTKPIATNDTEEGRALNRRTEFKVM
ncbi:MAG: OmpA family protein [Bacteroidota bacterium]